MFSVSVLVYVLVFASFLVVADESFDDDDDDDDDVEGDTFDKTPSKPAIAKYIGPAQFPMNSRRPTKGALKDAIPL